MASPGGDVLPPSSSLRNNRLWAADSLLGVTVLRRCKQGGGGGDARARVEKGEARKHRKTLLMGPKGSGC
jgi:hypothetical protein